MTIQTDISEARQRGASRRKIAEAAGLSEGIIWRIENKGNWNADEAGRLGPVLAQLLGRSDGDGGPGTGVEPGGDVDPNSQGPGPTAPLPSPAPQPARNPTQTQQVALETPPQPVDWGNLLAAAARVSEHDLERGIAIGPDRSLGFRLISNSEVQAFKECRRKWWLAYYRTMHLKHQSPIGPRAIGDRVHRAFKRWYVPAGHQRQDPRTALELLIAEDWTTLTKVHGTDSQQLAGLEKKFNEEANLERAMIEGYVQWLAETGADADLEILASEQYIEADVTDMLDFEQKTKLIAKLDVRARRKTDGVRMFIDHKTVAEFTTLRQIVAMDEQMLHYHLLEWLNTPEGEARCDGALYNMLRKVKRSGAAKPPFYDRVEVHHNTIELESYKRRVLATVRDIYDVEQALNAGTHHLDVVYPRPTRDCRWKCDFFMVCPMFDDGSRAEAMLANWYETHDTLDYYQTDVAEGDL